MTRFLGFLLLTAVGASAQQQRLPSLDQAIKGHFVSLNQRILDMAKDFPGDKYDYRPRPEVRSFAEVIVHIASGNAYAAKAGRGEKASWDELDPKDFPTKSAVVAMFEKALSDATTTLKAVPNEKFAATPEPWLGVIEHSAEHYGLLVVYYRLNGLVPPATRAR